MTETAILNRDGDTSVSLRETQDIQYSDNSWLPRDSIRDVSNFALKGMSGSDAWLSAIIRRGDEGGSRDMNSISEASLEAVPS